MVCTYASRHIVVGNLLGHAASAGSNSGPQSALIDPDLCTLVPHLMQYDNISSFDSQGRPLEPRTLTLTSDRHSTRGFFLGLAASAVNLDGLDLCTVMYNHYFFWYCFSFLFFLYFGFMDIDNNDGLSNTICFGGYMNDLHFDPFSVSDSRFIANNEDLDPENNYYNDL